MVCPLFAVTGGAGEHRERGLGVDPAAVRTIAGSFWAANRPVRAERRNGAKSPLDAVRVARKAPSQPRLDTPRVGGDRQAQRC